MTHDSGESVIIPYYGLSNLGKVSFVDFCARVPDLNLGKGPFTEGKLRQIYLGIVHGLFWFESEEKRLIAQYKVIPLIESRKHAVRRFLLRSH